MHIDEIGKDSVRLLVEVSEQLFESVLLLCQFIGGHLLVCGRFGHLLLYALHEKTASRSACGEVGAFAVHPD